MALKTVLQHLCPPNFACTILIVHCKTCIKTRHVLECTLKNVYTRFGGPSFVFIYGSKCILQKKYYNVGILTHV